MLTLRNPLSEEEPALRTTLLPGLLATLARNLARGQRDLALFEDGRGLPGRSAPGEDRPPAPVPGADRRPDDDELAALLAAVPAQPRHVAVALAGAREPRGWWGPGRPAVWADAVEAARRVAAAAGVALRVRGGRAGALAPRAAARSCWSPATTAPSGWSATPASCTRGSCAALDLPARTSAMELDLDALPPAPVPQAPRVSSFPPVLLDVALVVADDVPAADVEAALREGAGELLESVRLFDVYTGSPLSRGHEVAGLRPHASAPPTAR